VSFDPIGFELESELILSPSLDSVVSDERAVEAALSTSSESSSMSLSPVVKN